MIISVLLLQDLIAILGLLVLKVMGGSSEHSLVREMITVGLSLPLVSLVLLLGARYILVPLFERFDTETRHYITILQTTLLDFAEADDVVLMGRGGQWLLRGIPHVLRVRIIAPLEQRVRQWIKRTAELTGETPNQRAVADLVRRDDTERAGRMRYLYEVDASPTRSSTRKAEQGGGTGRPPLPGGGGPGPRVLPTAQGSGEDLDAVLHRLALAEPNVALRDGCEVRGLVVDGEIAGKPRVAGLRVRAAGGAEEALRADLLVDAAGRRSPLAAWLAAAGLPAPDEASEPCGVFYCSRFYRLRDGVSPPERETTIGADLGYLKFAIHGDARIFSITFRSCPACSCLPRKS